jgi:hypothetical protein
MPVLTIEYEDRFTKDIVIDDAVFAAIAPVTSEEEDDEDDSELRDYLAQHYDDEREGGHGVVLYWETKDG